MWQGGTLKARGLTQSQRIFSVSATAESGPVRRDVDSSVQRALPATYSNSAPASPGGFPLLTEGNQTHDLELEIRWHLSWTVMTSDVAWKKVPGVLVLNLSLLLKSWVSENKSLYLYGPLLVNNENTSCNYWRIESALPIHFLLPQTRRVKFPPLGQLSLTQIGRPET